MMRADFGDTNVERQQAGNLTKTKGGTYILYKVI